MFISSASNTNSCVHLNIFLCMNFEFWASNILSFCKHFNSNFYHNTRMKIYQCILVITRNYLGGSSEDSLHFIDFVIIESPMYGWLPPSFLFVIKWRFKEALHFFLHGCQRWDVARMGENEEGSRLMLSHEKKMYIIKERKHGLLFKVTNSVLVFPLG